MRMASDLKLPVTFASENQPIAREKCGFRKDSRSFGRHGKHTAAVGIGFLKEVFPTLVDRHKRHFVIVQTGTNQVFVVDTEP